MSGRYDHRQIEAKWQHSWLGQKMFRADENSEKPKRYVLDMFPYPSSAGLHVGHPLGYTATDIVSRYWRMKGYNVLHPMGWDAFGLPAENYAIKTKVHPAQTTSASIDNFRRQIQELGFSYDWEREINTSAPEYYRFTQWFFRFLYAKGLAYRKKAPVNWCESCHTVLANEQVVNGRCERCKNEVVQKELAQWFFKIRDFVEDQGDTSGLLSGLNKIDWPESTKIAQENWIGRSEGAEIDFIVGEEKLRIFTTRPDTIFGATYLVLAPEHPFAEKIATPEHQENVKAYIATAKKKTELERQEAKEKTGVFTGAYAKNPVNGELIPVWIADYVLVGYGTGAIMAVPAHDERDWEFSHQYNLTIKPVVAPSAAVVSSGAPAQNAEVVAAKEEHDAVRNAEKPYFRMVGRIINSGFLNDLTPDEAFEKILQWLQEKNCGERRINYRLRDWLVSRQRYWGAPIPVVYDDQGNHYLVPDDELPVVLPTDVDFMPTGESPLTKSESFHDPKDLARIEEKLKKSGVLAPERRIVRRESDTMDTFVCSSWYLFRYMDPHNAEVFAGREALEKWGPVDLYVGGAEHTVLHLLYARFFTKALHRYGYISYDEPFLKLRHQGMILGEDGQKMSKSRGNVINPDEIVSAFGADTLRCYEMFMGPFDQRKPWSASAVEGVRRFLDRAWRVFEKPLTSEEPSRELLALLHRTIRSVTEDIENFHFNTAISALMVLTNELTALSTAPRTVLEVFALLLAPFAPHLAEELWAEFLGHKKGLAYEPWPQYEETYLEDETVVYAVQVNGKVRGDFKIAKDTEKDMVLATAKELPGVQKYLEEKEIVKEIFVPGKIVGFVVK